MHPQLNQLIENKYPHFGYISQVETVNYLDAELTSPFGFKQHKLAKRLKINQFVFININHPDYLLSLAIANIQWLATAFFYIYNKKTNQIEKVDTLTPFAKGCYLNNSPTNATLLFKNKKLTIKINLTDTNMIVVLDCAFAHVNANISRQLTTGQALGVCTPTGYSGFSYTQKEQTMTCTGSLVLNSNASSTVNPIDLQPSLASSDWSLGYMRRETSWHWASFNTYLTTAPHQGDCFAINLSMGVNETGLHECACWLAGTLHHLPQILFKHNRQQPWQPWHISSLDGTVNLTFKPQQSYNQRQHIGVLASVFKQYIGYYSGTIRVGNEHITLNKVIGLAEDHYALW